MACSRWSLEEFPAPAHHDVEVEALVRTVKVTFERYVKLNRAVPPEMLLAVNALEEPDRLADTLVAPLQFKLEERQELLETVDVAERLERIYKALLTEIEFLQVEKKLKSRVKRERDNSQREYWLNEQMKAIQKELGDKEGRSDLEELAQALAAKNLPRVRASASREGAPQALPDEHDERGSHGGAQLPGLDCRPAVGRRQPGPYRASRGGLDARRRSLRPEEDQGADPRVSGRLDVGREVCADPSSAW